MELIEGVKIRQLRAIPDDRGRLTEILRSDWDEFIKFGQIYFTTANPGIIKAWHYHKIQTDCFFCIKGKARVALYDSRSDSKSFKQINEFLVGESNLQLIIIPPLVFHGFKAISDEEAIMLNIPTELYNYRDPDEYRIPSDSKDINYIW